MKIPTHIASIQHPQLERFLTEQAVDTLVKEFTERGFDIEAVEENTIVLVGYNYTAYVQPEIRTNRKGQMEMYFEFSTDRLKGEGYESNMQVIKTFKTLFSKLEKFLWEK